MLKNVIPF